MQELWATMTFHRFPQVHITSTLVRVLHPLLLHHLWLEIITNLGHDQLKWSLFKEQNGLPYQRYIDSNFHRSFTPLVGTLQYLNHVLDLKFPVTIHCSNCYIFWPCYKHLEWFEGVFFTRGFIANCRALRRDIQTQARVAHSFGFFH